MCQSTNRSGGEFQLQQQQQQQQQQYFSVSLTQGRIKVCGGPRLDTLTGPYPSFYLLSSPTCTEG